jgi:hypothetical protein
MRWGNSFNPTDLGPRRGSRCVWKHSDIRVPFRNRNKKGRPLSILGPSTGFVFRCCVFVHLERVLEIQRARRALNPIVLDEGSRGRDSSFVGCRRGVGGV